MLWSVHARRLLRVLVAAGSVTACASDIRPPVVTDQVTVPDDSSLGFGDTVPPETQLASAVAAGLVSGVQATIGVRFDTAVADCVTARLLDKPGAKALSGLTLGDPLTEAPQAIQDDVFTGFDACVNAETLDTAAGVPLRRAGVDDTKVTCLFRLIHDELGIAGYYRYSAGRDGSIAYDNRLGMEMRAIVDKCALDLGQFQPTTAPAPPVTDTLPPITRPPVATAPPDAVYLPTTTTSVAP